MNNKQEIIKQIEYNNNIIFKLQHINKSKCQDLLFENEQLCLKLQQVI